MMGIVVGTSAFARLATSRTVSAVHDGVVLDVSVDGFENFPPPSTTFEVLVLTNPF